MFIIAQGTQIHHLEQPSRHAATEVKTSMWCIYCRSWVVKKNFYVSVYTKLILVINMGPCGVTLVSRLLYDHPWSIYSYKGLSQGLFKPVSRHRSPYIYMQFCTRDSFPPIGKQQKQQQTNSKQKSPQSSHN